MTSIGVFISCSKQENENVNKVTTFELKATVAYNLKTKKMTVSQGIDTEIKIHQDKMKKFTIKL